MKARAVPTREQTEQRLRDMQQRRGFNFLQNRVLVIQPRRMGKNWAAEQARKALKQE